MRRFLIVFQCTASHASGLEFELWGASMTLIHLKQRGIRWNRFFLKYIQSRSGNLPLLQSFHQCRLVNNWAARGVDDNCAGLHFPEQICADQGDGWLGLRSQLTLMKSDSAANVSRSTILYTDFFYKRFGDFNDVICQQAHIKSMRFF